MLLPSSSSSTVSMDSNYFSNLTRSDSDSSNSTLNSTFSSFSSSITPSQSISSTLSTTTTQSTNTTNTTPSTHLYSESQDHHHHHSNHQSITSILNNISSQTHPDHHHEINKVIKSQSTSSTRNQSHQLPSPTISFRLYSIQSNLSKTSVSSTSPTSLSPKNLLKSTHINSIHQQLQQDLLHQDPLISPHTNYSNLDLFSHTNLSPSIQNWSDVPTPTSSVIAKRFSFLAELGIGEAAAEAASILFQTQSVSKSSTTTTSSPTAPTTITDNNDNTNINKNNGLTIKTTLVEKETIDNLKSVDKSDEDESNHQSLLIPNQQSPSSLSTYSARFRPESCWIQSSGYGELRLIKPSTSSATHDLPPIQRDEDQIRKEHDQKYQELYEETQSSHFQVQSNPINTESKHFLESYTTQDQESSTPKPNENQNQNQSSSRSTSFAQHVRTISSSSHKLKDRLPPTPLKINSLPITKRNTILVADPQDQAYESGSEQVIVESPSNLKPNITSNRVELHTWLNLDPYPTSGSSEPKTVSSKPTITKLTTNLSTELPSSTSSPSHKPPNQTVDTRSTTSSPLSSTDLLSKPSSCPTSLTPKPKADSKKGSPTNSINHPSTGTPTKRRKSLYQLFKSALQSSTSTPTPTPSPTNLNDQSSVVRPRLQRRSTRDCAPAPVALVATVRRTRSHSHATLNPSNKSPATSPKRVTSDSLYDDHDQDQDRCRSPFMKDFRRKSAKELMDVLLDVTDDNTFIKLAIENKSSNLMSSSSYQHQQQQHQPKEQAEVVDDRLSLKKIDKSELHHLFIIRELIKSEKSYLEHLISLQEAVEQKNQTFIKTSKSLQRASLYYLPNPTLQNTHHHPIPTKRSSHQSTSTSQILNFEQKLSILRSQLPLLINLSETLIERISESPTILGISLTFVGLEPKFENVFLGWIQVLNRIKFDFKDLRIQTPASSTSSDHLNGGGGKMGKNRLSWNDILIMPVQRVTRYHLFLTELMKLESNGSNLHKDCLMVNRNGIGFDEVEEKGEGIEKLVNLKVALHRSKSLAEVMAKVMKDGKSIKQT
ncbi:uncharacterized protein MELLADRAFT_102654 [Melampsora larici-populina 98AG31]|uniref:DH domain-containing protein n=1 Tax=Melampsora larici-populina (strain 98AG31 / pathotype 3-4-7) TaxID=747676 RepID=F4R8Y8_MELLP|nr:uncharacterized protein MELLADRAFT_102654 [Melampsora larici-populina 98AG31]EGG10893.1 hypothetical protein MELLADRAFT_102654 [Melampsora larici-populina 98AG31]